MPHKNYRPLYENYAFNIITPEVSRYTVNKIEHNPAENYEGWVHEIHIVDIPDYQTDYLNLDRTPGGLPRLNSKRGEFTENFSTRYVTRNGKKEIIYTSSKEDYALTWKDGKPQTVWIGKWPSDKREILIISAKDLGSALYQAKKDAVKPEIKRINKMGRSKFIPNA